MEKIFMMKEAWDFANDTVSLLHELAESFSLIAYDYKEEDVIDRMEKRLILSKTLDELSTENEEISKEYYMLNDCEYALETLKEYLLLLIEKPIYYKVLGELTERFTEKMERDLCQMRSDIIDLFVNSFDQDESEE